MSDSPYQPPQINTGKKSVGGGGSKPDNYLIHAIFATLCCCIPFGVVAIVFAAQVDSKWAQGDYVGSRKAAEKAKMWFWIALGLGLVGNLIGVGLQIALIGAEANGGF